MKGDRAEPGHRERTVDGERAWQNLANSSRSRWATVPTAAGYAETAHGRISNGVALAYVEPKFAIRDDDRFFCIGSCFARNIEEQLLYRGLPVASLSLAAPRHEWRGRPNGFVNKFTTASILNELEWAFGESSFPESSFIEDSNGWHDLQLAPGIPGAPRDRAEQRRRTVTEYFSRIKTSNVIIITLGLVEVWYDRAAEIYVNHAPAPHQVRRAPGRFSCTMSNYFDNLRSLTEILTLIKRYACDGVRVVLTVSPVPMSETFSGQDIIVANGYSKSVLRAVAQDIAMSYENVQYFPSYDAIATSTRSMVYESADNLHVRDWAVDQVTTNFLETFGIERERSRRNDPLFVEMDYLLANPDVHDAVIAGTMSSGYAHFLEFGRDEARPLCLGGKKRDADASPA